MGLTIHYSFYSKRADGAAQQQVLADLRTLAFELLEEGILTEVGTVKHFNGDALKAIESDRSHPDQWWYTQSQAIVKLDSGAMILVPPLEAYGLSTYPGPGCEPANFGLAHYPDAIEQDGKTYHLKLPGWRWGSFCKTTYAEHPLTCHLAVVALLDWLDQQPDIVLTVSDEGDYWQKRDVVALAREFRADAEFLAGLANILSQSNLAIEGPILERADYPELVHAFHARLATPSGDFKALSDLLKSLKDLPFSKS